MTIQHKIDRDLKSARMDFGLNLQILTSIDGALWRGKAHKE